jgi:hypothetical protein
MLLHSNGFRCPRARRLHSRQISNQILDLISATPHQVAHAGNPARQPTTWASSRLTLTANSYLRRIGCHQPASDTSSPAFARMVASTDRWDTSHTRKTGTQGVADVMVRQLLPCAARTPLRHSATIDAHRQMTTTRAQHHSVTTLHREATTIVAQLHAVSGAPHRWVSTPAPPASYHPLQAAAPPAHHHQATAHHRQTTRTDRHHQATAPLRLEAVPAVVTQFRRQRLATPSVHHQWTTAALHLQATRTDSHHQPTPPHHSGSSPASNPRTAAVFPRWATSLALHLQATRTDSHHQATAPRRSQARRTDFHHQPTPPHHSGSSPASNPRTALAFPRWAMSFALHLQATRTDSHHQPTPPHHSGSSPASNPRTAAVFPRWAMSFALHLQATRTDSHHQTTAPHHRWAPPPASAPSDSLR